MSKSSRLDLIGLKLGVGRSPRESRGEIAQDFGIIPSHAPFRRRTAVVGSRGAGSQCAIPGRSRPTRPPGNPWDTLNRDLINEPVALGNGLSLLQLRLEGPGLQRAFYGLPASGPAERGSLRPRLAARPIWAIADSLPPAFFPVVPCPCVEYRLSEPVAHLSRADPLKIYEVPGIFQWPEEVNFAGVIKREILSISKTLYSLSLRSGWLGDNWKDPQSDTACEDSTPKVASLTSPGGTIKGVVSPNISHGPPRSRQPVHPDRQRSPPRARYSKRSSRPMKRPISTSLGSSVHNCSRSWIARSILEPKTCPDLPPIL